MEYHELIDIKKELYDHFLFFFDDNQADDNFDKLIEIIHIHKYQEKSDDFKTILYLIREINKNHHRLSSHLEKIERFVSHYSEYIKQSFTKEELFNIFRKNPQILHFLFDKGIISIDDSIINLIVKPSKSIFVLRQYKGEKKPYMESEKAKFKNKRSIIENYKYYFYRQIKSKLDEEERKAIEKELLEKDENIFDNFDKKCMIGENHSYISELIRKDSIEEFVTYTNKAGIILTSEIKPSIFDTNPFLVSKPATLIEYAAFFGSIQIFQYLRMNQVELTPSLWLYSIHGNNPEIIHFLERDHVEPEDITYVECLKESIKCHHNEIAHYIQTNLLEEPIEIKESNFKNNPISCGFHFYNYEFLQEYEYFNNSQFLFFYACLYDHFPVVKLLIQMKKVDLNQKIISIIFF